MLISVWHLQLEREQKTPPEVLPQSTGRSARLAGRRDRGTRWVVGWQTPSSSLYKTSNPFPLSSSSSSQSYLYPYLHFHVSL